MLDIVKFNLVVILFLSFRVIPDQQWLVLKNVTIYKISTNKKNCNEKKWRRKRICKVDKMKMWCLDSVEDDTFLVVDDLSNPYVVEVEKKSKNKRKRMVLKEETVKVKKETFDPLLHVRELSHSNSMIQIKGEGDFLSPMPYNEKLRRGGEANSLLIAETQIGKLEVLKGRYRKHPREFPYRCVEDFRKIRMDVKIVDGKHLDNRTYVTLLRSQDRSLAELAVKAGNKLSNA